MNVRGAQGPISAGPLLLLSALRSQPTCSGQAPSTSPRVGRVPFMISGYRTTGDQGFTTDKWPLGLGRAPHQLSSLEGGHRSAQLGPASTHLQEDMGAAG